MASASAVSVVLGRKTAEKGHHVDYSLATKKWTYSHVASRMAVLCSDRSRSSSKEDAIWQASTGK
jgi:hypothetical protein